MSDASFDVSQIGNQYLGFGFFQKTGGSTWTLIGANTASGPWTIDSGTLEVNAALASSNMTVNSGGTLAGIGTVGSVNVSGGGTLAPGSAGSPGTLTVARNLVFQPGAIYLVRVNSSNAPSAGMTTGGTAALAGTVEAAFAVGSSASRNYTILHTAGLGGTTFDGLQISNLPGGFGASLDYTTTDALLELTATLGAGTGQLSGNQQQVATALNNFFNAGGALPPSFVNVFGLTGSNLNTALTQLSGEAGTGGQQAAFQLMTEFLTLMLDPFVDGRGGTVLGFAPNSDTLSFQLASADAASLTKSAPVAQGWTLWGGAYGGVNHTSGDPATVGSHDLTASTGGFAVGADYRLSPSTALGFALAGGGTGWSVAEGLGGGRSTAFQAGVYGKTTFGPAYVAASLAYTQHWMSTDRLSFGFDQLTAQFDAESFGGRAEGGYRFNFPIVAVTPYVGLQSQAFITPSYSESDTSGGSFGLSYAGRTATDTRSELGSRFDRTFALDPTTLLVLRAKLAWAHDWVSDPSLAAVFQALPGAGFIVRGATLPSDFGLVSAGAELHFASGLALAAKFDGEFAGRAHTLAGSAIVRYVW
jgi:autotransporter-associated beta strand protein